MGRGYYTGTGNGLLPFGFPWGGLLWVVLTLAAITVVGLFVVRALRRRTGDGSTAKANGLRILAERFARGEIDSETFNRMKAELDGMKD